MLLVLSSHGISLPKSFCKENGIFVHMDILQLLWGIFTIAWKFQSHQIFYFPSKGNFLFPDTYQHYFFRILTPDTRGMAKVIMAKYLARESGRVFIKKQTLLQSILFRYFLKWLFF